MFLSYEDDFGNTLTLAEYIKQLGVMHHSEWNEFWIENFFCWFFASLFRPSLLKSYSKNINFNLNFKQIKRNSWF